MACLIGGMLLGIVLRVIWLLNKKSNSTKEKS